MLFTLILLTSCNTQPKSVTYSTTPVTQAVPFAPEVISTKQNSEFSVGFSPDSCTVYLSRRAPKEKQQIYQATFTDSVWITSIVSSFSTDRDEEPSIAPDG